MKTLNDLHREGYKILISMEKQVDASNSTSSIQDIIDSPRMLKRLSHVQESSTTRYSLMNPEDEYIVKDCMLEELVAALKEFI